MAGIFIKQGIIGVLLASVNLIVGTFAIDPVWKGIIVVSRITFLSPAMAQLGRDTYIN